MTPMERWATARRLRHVADLACPLVLVGEECPLGCTVCVRPWADHVDLWEGADGLVITAQPYARPEELHDARAWAREYGLEIQMNDEAAWRGLTLIELRAP